MIDAYTLKMRQAMPLEDKIRFTERRINEWVKEFGEDGRYYPSGVQECILSN